MFNVRLGLIANAQLNREDEQKLRKTIAIKVLMGVSAKCLSSIYGIHPSTCRHFVHNHCRAANQDVYETLCQQVTCDRNATDPSIQELRQHKLHFLNQHQIHSVCNDKQLKKELFEETTRYQAILESHLNMLTQRDAANDD